jgi:hypothetical protein
MTDQDLDSFEPRNELEEQLLAVHQGRIAPEQFLQALLGMQVFMPVRDDDNAIEGFQTSTRAMPLSLEAEDGTKVLILFSSPERARPFLDDVPGFGGGILEDLKWILERMGGGYGIALNPGWEAGIDLEPDMVTQLAQLAVTTTE